MASPSSWLNLRVVVVDDVGSKAPDKKSALLRMVCMCMSSSKHKARDFGEKAV